MKHISLFAPGVGELSFDRRGAIVSALDVGYPEIKRVGVDTLAASHTLSVGVGGSKLTLEGYLIDENALDPSGAGKETPALTCAGKDSESGGAGKVPRLKRLLSSIAAPGREFSLTVGGLSRSLYALSLTFDSEAPFSSPHAEKFKLVAYSDDPYFRGGEIGFAGTPGVSSALPLPAGVPFALGVMQSGGTVGIDNRGDETCGFVLRARFTSPAGSFAVESDREDGTFLLDAEISAGDAVVIDTRSGRRAVYLEGGDSLLADVDADSAFFSAPPGRTTLTWSASCDTPPVVTVRLTPGRLNV